MNYYRDQVTQKSWELLQRLAKNYRFVLIGGWAVWLYTHQLKSKDIDLVVDFDVLEKLRRAFPLFKNERLKKYEIVQAEVQIDIYVPHYSQLGLPIPTITSHTTLLEGFRVPTPEILLLLKQTAHTHRSGTPKGRKDLLDITSLLCLPQFNWPDYSKLASPDQKQHLAQIIRSQTSLPELNLNPHQFSRLKKICLSHLC